MKLNKKAQTELIILILGIFVIAILLLAIFWNVSYQHGTSKDVVQGYDKGVFWHHAYLKNDHSTAYCFDNENFIPILEQSQLQNKEVVVTYDKYVGRGTLCSAAQNYETVVVTDIRLANE